MPLVFISSRASFILTLMLVWWVGQRDRAAAADAIKVRIADLLRTDENGAIHLATPGMQHIELALAPGIGIYYQESTELGIAPPVMVQLLRRCKAIHKVSLLVTVRVQPVPHVPPSHRVLVRPIPGADNCYQVIACWFCTNAAITPFIHFSYEIPVVMSCFKLSNRYQTNY